MYYVDKWRLTIKGMMSRIFVLRCGSFDLRSEALT